MWKSSRAVCATTKAACCSRCSSSRAAFPTAANWPPCADGQALAVGVLHDEDGDKRMATGLFGIPKEGFGVSNNPRILFGPPRFEDARLVPQPGQPIIIDMKYF
jgi:uncharacterized protein (DUF2141 family)